MSNRAFTLPAVLAPAGAVAAALMAIQMRNLDALAAAQKAAMEGLGTLAKQQQDMLTARLQDAGSLATAVPGADPRAALAKPLDSLKTAILEGTAQANLLSELAARSGATVAGILQGRLVASLDELKAALLQAMPPTTRA